MENNEESKTPAEGTAEPVDSQELENKTAQPLAEETALTNKLREEDQEQVTLSAKEVETLRKKAEDFERMTKTKRGEKLLSKMKSVNTEEEIVEEYVPPFDAEEFKAETIKAAEEAALRIVDTKNQEDRKVNIASAWDSWVAENPWANDDEVFDGITKNIQPTNSTKKEDLLAELDRAALLAHPRLYTQNMESKIRSKILVEQHAIDAGAGGGNGTSVKKEEVDVVVTKEDQTIIDKYFNGDKARFLKTKINN